MPIRVFELAKELEISANVLNERVNELGIESKGNFTVLSDEQIKDVKKSLKSPESMAQSKAPSSLDGAKKVRRRISTKAPAETPKKLKKKKEIEEEAEAAAKQEEKAVAEEASPVVEETSAPAESALGGGDPG